MYRLKVLTVFIFIISSAFAQEKIDSVFNLRGEVKFIFAKPSNKTLNNLSKFISIDLVENDSVIAYANSQGFAYFNNLDIDFRIIPIPIYAKSSNSLFSQYPTYSQYKALLEYLKTKYSGYFDYKSIGKSVNGRDIFAIKISDNVEKDEDEPEFLISAGIHGDELVGFNLALRLVNYILSSYNTNTAIKSLIEGEEIWILPLENPDGAYYYGDDNILGGTRFNANWIDLNRNFPDPDGTINPDGYSTQMETSNIISFLKERNFSLSLCLHGGTTLVNYPWDTWYELHPENDYLIYLSRMYADTVHVYAPDGYMDINYNNFINGITNGYQWYTADGTHQDYSTFYTNSKEVTIELSNSKTPPDSELDSLWKYNYRSLINWIEQCLRGIEGYITGVQNIGLGNATISLYGIDDNNSTVHSETTGYFNRPLDLGMYTIKISSPGYYDTTISISLSNEELLNLGTINLKKIENSISKTKKMKDPNVSPNPFTTQFTLRFSNLAKEKISFDLISTEGITIERLHCEEFEPGDHFLDFETDHLEKGIYIIRMTGDIESSAIKIVKR